MSKFLLDSQFLEYGGGGGGGGPAINNISYKTFNLCLKNKGYKKNKNGLFKLPFLSCE